MIYKNYLIDGGMVRGYYTVLYRGDEIVFRTIAGAIKFIDEITK